jgi:hypothetical protein
VPVSKRRMFKLAQPRRRISRKGTTVDDRGICRTGIRAANDGQFYTACPPMVTDASENPVPQPAPWQLHYTENHLRRVSATRLP